MNMVALFPCLQSHVPATTCRQCHRMALAMMVMTGRVTMLGIARWAGKGGSYRTVQRFFATVIPWAMLFWVFFRQHVYCPGEVYLLVGDEVVVTKAGKITHGLDRFFSSLYGKPIPGLAFFAFSLVGVQARCAFPVRVEQVVAAMPKKRPGRPKQQPRSSDRRLHRGALGGPRAARTPPKPM